tara:strand:+ start:318 stop:440 length:123 start_codon:yes stop_codon:yes gene_type:complete
LLCRLLVFDPNVPLWQLFFVFLILLRKGRNRKRKWGKRAM